jgi:hypothetical protein
MFIFLPGAGKGDGRSTVRTPRVWVAMVGFMFIAVPAIVTPSRAAQSAADASSRDSGSLGVTGLRVDNTINPLGIDRLDPQL